MFADERDISDDQNPYKSPEAAASGGVEQEGKLTVAMVRYLKEASPWIRFIGVLGYIGTALIAIGGIAMLAGGGQIMGAIPGFGGMGALIGIVYLGTAVVVFFLSRFCHRFGSKIKRYAVGHQLEDLEEAFRNNKSLWKFYGILVIIYLALIPVLIAVLAVSAAAAY